jgi:type VI secretion system protein ImpC
VAPHVLPKEDPQVPALMARVDATASELMRAILHHQEFQALEAAWRAVHFLVHGLETNEQLKVFLLDISALELAEDLRNSGGLEQSALYRLVAARGAPPWALLAGNFSFSQTESDIGTLGRLAQLSRAAGAPFLAEANPAQDDPAGWHALRRSPAASWVGLALPRFLLRLPYGKDTDPIESFGFEEMPGEPVHQEYLWGNPAFGCAYLLGQAFSADGWDLRPGAYQEVEGLPLHVYGEGREAKLQSCAEVEMSESDAEWVLDQGCMPLVWMKGQSSVCLLRFQSIADPPAPLSGRWS